MQELLESVDKDKDGIVSESEYLGELINVSSLGKLLIITDVQYNG